MKYVKRAAALLLETLLLLTISLYGLLFVITRGPSPAARDLFVRSVRETSAVGFLADLFLEEDQIQEILNAVQIQEYTETDTSLIQITGQPEPAGTAQPDAWGLVDEDGDGIILKPVTGKGYSGYMMVVLDPSRVIMGCNPGAFNVKGYTVEQMAEQFDAVAAINAGGFYDPEGNGDGSMPDTMVVYEGEVFYPERGTSYGFVGFDKKHIMHVGKLTEAEVREREIQYGVCFGPVLIANGEACDVSTLYSGINPRTAIGQRSDGAVLMLVIDGRQVISLGATYQDLVEIMLDYGAVNACNLDGGSSTLMWYNGEYVNNCASVIGIRPVPTSFVVLQEGGGKDD